jgi:hypothetical protein
MRTLVSSHVGPSIGDGTEGGRGSLREIRWEIVLPLLFLAPFLVSASCWLIYEPLELGFFEQGREALSLAGASLYLTWILVSASLVWLGAKAGSIGKPIRSVQRASLETVQLFALLCALVGVVAAYWQATSGAPGTAMELWRARQFNELRNGLEYSAGLQTLRYASILCGGIAMFRVLARRVGWIDIVSLGVLGLNAALSSRMALLMAGVMALLLWREQSSSAQQLTKKRGGRALVACISCLIAFVAFNYSRNATYYETVGIENPLHMALENASAYLVAPTQVSVGGSRAFMQGSLSSPESLERSIAAALTPTYLRRRVAEGNNVDLTNSIYEGQINISPRYNANGAFIDILLNGGLLGLALASGMLGLVGYIAARVLSSGYVGVTLGAVLIYVLMDTWRTYLLVYGIVHLLALCVVSSVMLSRLIARR